MILELRIYAETGTRYGKKAFQKMIQRPILISKDGARVEGELLNAIVDPSGSSVNLVIEVPDD